MLLEKSPKIGDKVRIVRAADGALGANGLSGTVTRKKGSNGCGYGIKVLMSNGDVWTIGDFKKVVLESIEEPIEEAVVNKEEETVSTEIPQVFSMFGDNNVQFKKYESLMPKNEYDREKAETLAEAMTELVQINKRKSFLESLMQENKDLKKYTWASNDGVVRAIHTIDEGHFRRILQNQVLNGRPLSKALRAEAASRGMEVPETYTSNDELLNDEWVDRIF